MIKANELRIGNRCAYGAHGAVIVSEVKETGRVRVTHIEQHSIDNGYSSSLLWADDIDPIPLTPEILEKCGFYWHNVNGSEYYFHAGLLFTRLIKSEEEDEGYCVFVGDANISGTTVDSVHQVQNLYFALTSEELQVTI